MPIYRHTQILVECDAAIHTTTVAAIYHDNQAHSAWKQASKDGWQYLKDNDGHEYMLCPDCSKAAGAKPNEWLDETIFRSLLKKK